MKRDDIDDINWPETDFDWPDVEWPDADIEWPETDFEWPDDPLTAFDTDNDTGGDDESDLWDVFRDPWEGMDTDPWQDLDDGFWNL